MRLLGHNPHKDPAEIYHKHLQGPSPSNPGEKHILPTTYQDGRLVTKGISSEGESGRAGFHFKHFLQITIWSGNIFSAWLNIFWLFVPAAIALHWAAKDAHVAIFAVNYVAMIGPANTLGFAGQEFAKKLPRVFGILAETTLGSVVEIVLFVTLVVKALTSPTYVSVLQAAILGSIMTNLLLCLGCCFVVGHLKNRNENAQRFSPVISETGSGIMLVAGFALMIPSAFYATLVSRTNSNTDARSSSYTSDMLQHDVLGISHGTSIILIVAFIIYMVYSAFSAHTIFDAALGADQEKDRDKDRDQLRKKYTMLEAVIVIVICIALVAIIAVFLVEQIHYIVEYRHVPDAFLGFILVPLVEKLAEHVAAIDEAYDNQMNFALYHCIGPSIQTALFNAPLVVIIGWILGVNMDLNFEIFMIAILILSILVVSSFLRDGESTYLEGSLLIVVYAIIALTTWYYPNPTEATSKNGTQSGA